MLGYSANKIRRSDVTLSKEIIRFRIWAQTCTCPQKRLWKKFGFVVFIFLCMQRSTVSLSDACMLEKLE